MAKYKIKSASWAICNSDLNGLPSQLHICSMQFGAPLIFGIIAALVARNKGYNWVYWLLALGLVGMIVIILMPDANKTGLSYDEKTKILKRGDLTGGILSAVSVVLVLISLVLIYSTKPR